MRSTIRTVTFERPFIIAGADGPHPAGDYQVTTDEEEIPGLSFVAWRRIGTSMRFPSLGTPSAMEQWVSITPDTLDAALKQDHPIAD